MPDFEKTWTTDKPFEQAVSAVEERLLRRDFASYIPTTSPRRWRRKGFPESH